MHTKKWILLSLIFFSFFIPHLNASSKVKVIEEIPPNGVVIDTPGYYVLNSNLSWSPRSNGQAILVTSKDVTIDLQSYKIRSEPSSYATTGIVALLSENLTIKNGTIENMSYRGIDCTACSKIVIKHITVDGLYIENTETYTVPVGILITASVDALVDKCIVKNINVKTGSCAAIQMTGIYDSKIYHCHISNMLNRDGACTGIGHLLCDLAEVKSCTLKGLTSKFINNLNTEGHTAIGIIPFISTNLIIKDCKVSKITGCCDDAHGISIFECTNAKVKNCHIDNVIDGVDVRLTGAKATGIEVYGSDVQVSKCTANFISAINPQDKQATGFSCAQGARIKFIDCEAKNVKVYNTLGIEGQGFGIGYGWAPDPRIVEPAIDVLFKNCTAKHCQIGFDSWFFIDSVWDHITSKCNGIDILNQDDSAQRTVSCDACSECGCSFPGCYPNPFVVTITNVARNNVFLHVKTEKCD